MSLRARLWLAFVAILVGPAVLVAALLDAATAGAGTATVDRARTEQAVLAVRGQVVAACARLTAAARALAVTAAARHQTYAWTPPAAAGPWALCGQPAAPAAATLHYTGLAARAPVTGGAGRPSGWAYAVQPLDRAFLDRLSQAAGMPVRLLAAGQAPTSPDQPLPLSMSAPAPTAAPAGRIVVALAAIAVAVTAALGLGWWLAGVATRPLELLLTGVQRVSAGDLSARVRLRGRDEAAQLGAALDRLASGMLEMQQAAITDALTGLGNRRQLADSLRLEVERAARFGRTLGVLALDLDHFKQVNDAYGHRAGDTVLAEFARRLRSVIREVDLPFRQGGEEFVILLPETGVTGSLVAAQRIGDAVRAEPFTTGGPVPGIRMTVSIGVAVFPRHGGSDIDTLEAADAALYAAKAAGRDTFVLASSVLPGQRRQRVGSPGAGLWTADLGGASAGTTSP